MLWVGTYKLGWFIVTTSDSKVVEQIEFHINTSRWCELRHFHRKAKHITLSNYEHTKYYEYQKENS